MSIGASYENKHTTTLCYISYNSISLQFCNLTLGGDFHQTIRNALYLNVIFYGTVSDLRVRIVYFLKIISCA